MGFQFLGMDFSHYVVWFFIYSFLGWGMECVVIRKQLGYWENRGFARLPFCVIYGFGCTIAIPMFASIKDDPLSLFFFGAVAATMFEYLTALVMLKLFGKVWWDYNHMRFNYKGILCAESTLGWGFLAVFIIGFFNDVLLNWVSYIGDKVAFIVALVLVVMYVIDFGISFYQSFSEKEEKQLEETYTYKED